MATLAMLLIGTTVAAHATPAACRERLLPPSLGAATGQRAVTARDLIELRDFGSTDNSASARPAFSLSPDGRFAAIVVRRADVFADGYCLGIAVVSLDGSGRITLLDVGGEPIPAINDIRGIPAITSGVPLVLPPIWSRDGRSLFYLRRDHGVTQVWRASLAQSPKPITKLSTDVLSLDLSRDGKTLLVRTRPSLQTGEATIMREGKRGYHFDARFLTLSEDKPRPALPLPDEFIALDIVSRRISPLSAQAAASLRQPDPDGRPTGALLYTRSALGHRAWTSQRDPRKPFATAALHVATDKGELPCPEGICARRVAAIWWENAETLLILRGGGPEDRGRLSLFAWNVTVEDAPRLRFSTESALIGCIPWRGALLCAEEHATQPRRLVRLDPQNGEATALFDPNPEAAGLAFGSVERLSWTNALGMRTYGDLVLPPTHRPGQRHPLIVVQYSSRGFLRGGTGDEYPIFLLARYGFAVLSFQRPAALPATEDATDIDALQRINIADWAERRAIFSALDLGIDASIEGGAIDPDRIGITGMSDGATTTQFALNNSSRFKAAAISTCCDEPSGSFSVGPAYRDSLLAWGYPRHGESDAAFWKPLSLAANAATMRTPLLIQIPDQEYRWSLETVSALQQHGAPVDMYVFPDESHVKAGPAHRLAIYERSVGWFGFWLLGATPDAVMLVEEETRWRRMRSARNHD